MFRILILMSTYNGESYLHKQIKSILEQEHVDVSLMVRDDGSFDHTKQILADYASHFPNIKVVYGDNMGFVQSFTELANLAWNKAPYDFYAFADQDDEWYPNKLEKACGVLSERNHETPNLFTSNSELIDDHSDKIGVFHQTSPYYTRQNIMVYGAEQGCSMVFNRKALEMYHSYPPISAWHDRWMLLICAYLGNYIYDHTPLFGYRIHSGNTLYRKNGSLCQRIKEDIVYIFTSKRYVANYEIASEFFSLFETRMNEEDKKLFRRYIGYRKRLLCKIALLFKLDNPQQDLPFLLKMRSKIGIIRNKL